MKSATKLVCLWPGLARLWLRGQWRGLAVACGFAVVINLLILMTLIWPEVAPAQVQASGWIVLGLWWVISAAVSLKFLPEIATPSTPESHKGLLVLAQGEYLKGNWVEAESLLRKLLRRQSEDVEAMLLLATLLRRSDRFDEARLQLQNLARLEAAQRWDLEIRRERQQLRRLTEELKAEAEKQKTELEPKLEESASQETAAEETTSVDATAAPGVTNEVQPAETQLAEVQLEQVPSEETTTPEENQPGNESEPVAASQNADTNSVPPIAEMPIRRQAA